MKKLFLIFFLFKGLIANSCYSILTKTDIHTPVAPNNVISEVPNYSKCKYFDESILFDNHLSYIGCSKNRKKIEKLYERLKKAGFHFENEKIVKHKITNRDVYLIFPGNPYIKKYYNLTKIYKKYSIKNVEKMFSKKIENKISIIYLKLEKLKFLPPINIYRFYELYKKKNFSQNVIILYKGSITLENLYKKIHNKNILEKRGNRYILKYPLYISPTATLIVKNKTLLLESYPKPVFVMYNGNLFIKDSKIFAWDIKHNRYYPHPFIPEKKLLLIGKQRPRPYFIGLAGSKTIFLNNIIKGLGFHDTIGAFGIAVVHYPRYLNFKLSYLNSFLGSREKANGIFMGNDIYNNMMGFYSNGAKNVVLIGNIFHDNLIYDVDPHDYSTNFIIARNLTYKAHHAHGIVISRQVENSIIAENFSFKNHSAGIMLDRLSNHNIIYKNLCMENGYMGISIQESDDVLIKNNYLIRNYIDGIIIRNSLRNRVENNYIFGNAKNGIEISVKDLKNIIYRDFSRDPYHKASSVIVTNNKIENSYNYNLMAKNSAGVLLINNHLKGRDVNKNYGGDLNFFVDKIENSNKFTLYGRGYPYRRISSDLLKLNKASFKEAISILRDVSLSPNLNAGIVLAYIYRVRKLYDLEDKELKREATNLISNALSNLGFLYLIKARENGYKNEKYLLNALSYIIESAIMGNKNASVDISYLPILSKIRKDEIESAFFIAKNRMEKGLLFDRVEYRNCEYCKRDKFIKNLINSYLQLFLYKKRELKIAHFYDYALYIRNNMTLFSREVINSIKENSYKANSVKNRYYRVQEKIMSEANKNYSCRYFLNKNFNFNNQVLLLMQDNLKSDYKKYSHLVDEYIDKINKFRKRKINKNEIYKILRKQNDKNFNVFNTFIDE